MLNENVNRPVGRPRDQRTDEAVLEAALELLIDFGVEATSIEKIAQRAGTTRAAIYRRYKNKEDLLVHAVIHVRQRNEAALGPWETMSLREIAQLYRKTETIETLFRYTRLLARLIGSVGDHPEIMAAYNASDLEPRRVLFGKILERAKADGTLRSDADIEIITDMFVGAIVARLLLRDRPADIEQMRDYIDRLFTQIFPEL
ncbi:TetR/AcrR family transcriptional regulator [Martelella soudanensis]|uniref:TetR/AcrR family transcriptional regulator n=1 Tax=unclassified Martelella TaxID=2629616 RepID=UPI0015DD82F9|nr:MULTISPECIES: TetR/AcrR family transcriptional regulator [unclassified Martelella]